MRIPANFIWMVFLLPLIAHAGEYGGEFLRNGIGARGLALGNTYASIADDATAPYWNPAGASLLRQSQVMAMYAPLFNGLASHQYVGAVLPLPGGVALGLSLNRLSIDHIPVFARLNGTPEDRYANPENRGTGVAERYFGDTQSAYYFTFSKTVTFLAPLGWSYTSLPVNFSAGANLKYLSHTIGDYGSGSGVGVDVGVLLQVDGAQLTSYDPLGRIAFGLSVSDIAGTRISWNTASARTDAIKTNIRFGASLRQPIPSLEAHHITLALDATTLYHYTRTVGVEYEYENQNASLRLGYALRGGWDGDRFTAGAGLYLWKFNLDYAYSRYDIGNTSRISLLMTL